MIALPPRPAPNGTHYRQTHIIGSCHESGGESAPTNEQPAGCCCSYPKCPVETRIALGLEEKDRYTGKKISCIQLKQDLWPI